MSDPSPDAPRTDPARTLAAPGVWVDAAIDLTLRGGAVATRGAFALARLGRPFVGLLLRPPGLPERWWPQNRLLAMAGRGQQARVRVEQAGAAWVDVLVPRVVDELLDRVDVTQIVLQRVALTAIVDRVLEVVDVDAVVARADLDAVIGRIDLDAIAAKLDVDAVVARVDVNSVAATVDLDAILDRVDVVGMANQVVDEIDLPGIIRQSSGAMASETVVGVRLQAAQADERVNRIVDRLLLRRRGGDDRSLEPP